MRDTTDPVARRLRILRLERALTQTELADFAGVARTTLIRLERDARRASPVTIRLLAEALGVPPMAITIGNYEANENPAPRMQPAVRG